MTPAGDVGCLYLPRGGSDVPVAITKTMTLVMVTFQGETKGRGGVTG